MFVEHPRPSLTALALDVKLLRPIQDIDTIFSNQCLTFHSWLVICGSIPIVLCLVDIGLGVERTYTI